MRIELQQIGKKYGKLSIFKNITANFESGSIYGLVGFNGSGKSTLLQIISGYITPNQGTIFYKDQAANLEIEHWYKNIAIAAPYLDLFEEFTILESIALHCQFKPLISNKTISDLLTEIDLENHKDKLLSQLSSGMRQRLKLALALYSDTKVLLLDEPCANLDERWANWFNATLEENSLDKLVIICSNNQENEMRCINSTILNVSEY